MKIEEANKIADLVRNLDAEKTHLKRIKSHLRLAPWNLNQYFGLSSNDITEVILDKIEIIEEEINRYDII